MITIKNVRTLGGAVVNHEIPSQEDREIDAQSKLLLFPGVIDPHICFGSVDSHDWSLAVESAIKGGITTAIEIPAEILPYNTKQELEQKNKRIAKGLLDLKIPLNHLSYLLYSNSNLKDIDQLGKEKHMIKGIIIHLNSGKKEELNENWEGLFRLAAQEDVPIVIDLDNENLEESYMARERLLEKAIQYIEKSSNRLYVLNVATEKEINLIQEARKRFLLVYAETTLQYLLSEDLAQANHLWKALNTNVIETIGSGYHINQQSRDKILYKGESFSFLNPIFFLPFLLTAVNEKKISLEKLAHLTSINICDIFEIKKSHDFVLIDLEKEQTVQKINFDHTVNLTLKGWPTYTIIQGHVFSFFES